MTVACRELLLQVVRDVRQHVQRQLELVGIERVELRLTDANDVDFHVKDGHGNHAFYSHPRLSTGGELYADVTTGYGPECFTIRGARGERAGPYTLQAHYYSRGPMGYGMGKLQIVEHDGKGGLTFEDRPFVVMNDHAFVDLGYAR